MKKNGKPRPSTERMAEKAYRALRKAVADVIEEHHRLKMPLVVSQNGKVVYVPADKISSTVRESGSKYVAKKKK